VGCTSVGLFLHRLAVTSADRARLIEELQAAKRELELGRQRDAELAALRERERLARDLHDSLGHGLVTLTVQLEALPRLHQVDPGRAAALAEEMKKLTRTCTEQLRRSLAGLRAPGLGDLPLSQALEGLCAETTARAAMRADCQVRPEADRLSAAVAETLWRVVQEGFANAEKHAQATEVRAVITVEPQTVILRVTDNGRGLPPDAEARPGHYGLRGLRERVEGLGGLFTLAAHPPRGTLLEARIPLIA